MCSQGQIFSHGFSQLAKVTKYDWSNINFTWTCYWYHFYYAPITTSYVTSCEFFLLEPKQNMWSVENAMNRTVADSCLSNSHLTNLRSSNFNDNNNNNDNKKYFYIICCPHIGLSNILPSRADQGMQDGLIFTPRKQLYSVNVFYFFLLEKWKNSCILTWQFD